MEGGAALPGGHHSVSKAWVKRVQLDGSKMAYSAAQRHQQLQRQQLRRQQRPPEPLVLLALSLLSRSLRPCSLRPLPPRTQQLPATAGVCVLERGRGGGGDDRAKLLRCYLKI
jgi:hypothetical protein